MTKRETIRGYSRVPCYAPDAAALLLSRSSALFSQYGWFASVAGVVLAFVAFAASSLRYRLNSEVGPVALFYPCVVALFTCLLWLIFFR